MPAMTRSPLALARQALACAQEALPPYSSKFSRKDFTLHQCFAILVLKHFFQTDYRSIEQYLKDMSDLRDALGLARVPDHSTLCRAHGWLLKRGLSMPS
jgi:hypothetical protein